MIKNPGLYKNTLVFGSIAISVLILLASLPSVFASNTISSSNKIKEIRDSIVNNIKKINGGSPKEWTPGQFLIILVLTLGLYSNFLKNNSWFPGLTFIMAYLFVILCILSLAETPENSQILDLKQEIIPITDIS